MSSFIVELFATFNVSDFILNHHQSCANSTINKISSIACFFIFVYLLTVGLISIFLARTRARAHTHTHTHTYIYIYIYIYILSSTDRLFCCITTTSVSQDPLDASSWDRNAPNFALDNLLLCCFGDLRQLRNIKNFVSTFVCFHLTLSDTGVLNSLEGLCVTQVATSNSFARVLNPWEGSTHTHERAHAHTDTHTHIYIVSDCPSVFVSIKMNLSIYLSEQYIFKQNKTKQNKKPTKSPQKKGKERIKIIQVSEVEKGEK